MKKEIILYRLSLLLVALVMTASAWAQGGSGNGSETFTIASKADWKKFCERVNDGENTLNARLTRDIDLGTDICMLGTDTEYYSGTLDGQGHSLTIDWSNDVKLVLAPITFLKNATIKNLHTKGQIKLLDGAATGLCISAMGGTNIISGCISEVNITGNVDPILEERAAGIMISIIDDAQVTISDCLVKGTLSGASEKSRQGMTGFVCFVDNKAKCTLNNCLYTGESNAIGDLSTTFAYKGAILNNCYYLNPCGKPQGTQITEGQLKSGYVAHLLQNGRSTQFWGQTLGTDAQPMPTGNTAMRVWKVDFTYNGGLKATRYANNNKTVSMPTFTAQDLLGSSYNAHHYYTLTLEGGFNGSTTVNADRTVRINLTEKEYYEIASKDDWKTFCDLVSGGQSSFDVRMTRDVDLGQDILIVGTDDYRAMYSGIFDGQGHVLTLDWNDDTHNDVSPFRNVNGGSIRNLRVQGSITVRGVGLTGLVKNVYGTVDISGCVSDVKITSNIGYGACKSAGMVKWVSPEARLTFNDCIVKGRFNSTSKESALFINGFVLNQNGTCTFNNCLYAGNHVFSSGVTFANSANTTFNNCYYLNTCGAPQGTQITAEQLKSGAVAWMLQNGREEMAWGQTIGTDDTPLPTTNADKRVCKVTFIYESKEVAARYANRGGHVADLPTVKEILGEEYNENHDYTLAFDDNFSTSTTVDADRFVAIAVTDESGYEIASKEDWVAFCNLVNGGKNDINAKLTRDIDLGSDIVTMGGFNCEYRGTFDGGGHSITINWNDTGYGKTALFKFVRDAIIKNVRVKGTFKTNGNQVTGLICNAVDNVTVSGCISEVDITSTYKDYGSEVAGLIFHCFGNVKIIDCIVSGTINATGKGREKIYGFVSRHYGTLAITNCLYAGTNNAADNSHTFAYDNNLTLTNCYYLNACGTPQGTQITEEQLRSGAVAWMLQNGRADMVWGQLLGTDTIPQLTDEAKKHVHKVEFIYNDKVAAARYANTGKTVKLPTVQEILGAAYNAQDTYTLIFDGGFSETTAITGDRTVNVTVNITTGIDGVTAGMKNGAVYDLQGRRVANRLDDDARHRLPAGVYIVNGRKIVVK